MLPKEQAMHPKLEFSFDDRRNVILPGDLPATIHYCAENFIDIGRKAISERGVFTVALSGGSTPKAIFQRLSDPMHRNSLDWSKVFLFWSDERCVPPYHPDSNYRSAIEAGFGKLQIPSNQIFRMQGEGDPEEGALAYEELIRSKILDGCFDLMTLGVGEDGHTASLFPQTHGLHSVNRLVVANYIPQKDVWRLTLTFDCINAAHNIVLYVTGKGKAEIVQKVFTESFQPDLLPVQNIGTGDNKAFWIMDQEAFSLMQKKVLGQL